MVHKIREGEIVEIFSENRSKNMKNGRFGSGFLHVSQKMSPLRDPTCGYDKITLKGSVKIERVLFSATYWAVSKVGHG